MKSQVAYAVLVVAMFATFLPDVIRIGLAAIDDSGAPIWIFYLAVIYMPVAALEIYRLLAMPIPCAAMVD